MQVFIESPSNPKVKLWSSLKSKKGRENAGAFLAEGVRLVREALLSRQKILAVLRDAGASETVDDLYYLASEQGVPVYDLSPTAYAAITDTVTPQGIAAVVELPRYDVESALYPVHGLMLDGLQDPGNVGTLLRTAEAFGISEVCLGLGTADAFSPKVVRASMGGIFRLAICETTGLAYLDEWRKHHRDGQIVVCEAEGATPCDAFDFRNPTLIVIGSEASGPSAEVSSRADTLIRIPMNQAVESLNAAIAGSVVLYEAYRQRQ